MKTGRVSSEVKLNKKESFSKDNSLANFNEDSIVVDVAKSLRRDSFNLEDFPSNANKYNKYTNRSHSANNKLKNTQSSVNKSFITGTTRKLKVPPKIAPLDPKLYKVSMDEVMKEYEKLKSSKNKKIRPIPSNISIRKGSDMEKEKEKEKEYFSHNASIIIANPEKNDLQENSGKNINSDDIKNQNIKHTLTYENFNQEGINKPIIEEDRESKSSENTHSNNHLQNTNESTSVGRGININKLNVLNIAIPKNKKINKKVSNKKMMKTNMPLMKIMKQIIPINMDNNHPVENKRKLSSEAKGVNLLPINKEKLENTIVSSSGLYPKRKIDYGVLPESKGISDMDVKKEENILNKSENKKNKEAMLDNAKCVLCLKRVKKPIIQKCNHEICLECAQEVKSIYEFFRDDDAFVSQFIKCPDCEEKTMLPDGEFEPLLRKNWLPYNAEKNEELMKSRINNTCEICPSSKAIRDFAEFECLNCDIIICYECKIRHLANPRHQDHKIIQVTQLVQEKVELTLCDAHREPMKLFCITENKPCCLVCSNYENLHEGHDVKSIRVVIENSTLELSSAIKECEPQIKIIENLISQMQNVKTDLEEEQSIFLKKLNNFSENLIDSIKSRIGKIEETINQTFYEKMKFLNKKLYNFNLLDSRYNYYKNIVCDRDIDILDRIKQIKSLNQKIHKLEEKESLIWESFGKNSAVQIDSLKASIFIEDPTEKMKKLLDKFDFLPLTEKHFSILKNMFSESNIVQQEFISSDLLVTLPKIRSGCLLYKVSREGPSTQLFHELCDDKGPTILLVKTEDGHIFGGYNPISWINEYMYNETEDAFLFSITDGNFRKPYRCPVKRSLKKFAIKQNEKDYSPGFGETDQADLLISFKNLNNSYSSLGNVYKCPRGYNPKEFLAGRPNNWKIVDVEVYAVEVMNSNEYYDVIRS